MQALLDRLGRELHDAQLEFVAPSGARWNLGHGRVRATLRLRSAAVLRRILSDPRYEFAAAYVRGDWEPEQGDLLRVLEIAARIQLHWEAHGQPLWRRALAWLGERNSALRSRDNVHAHYDREADFYASFLDRDWHYSCAYFAGEAVDLDAAQQAKCAHIARKLNLPAHARVLDVGCGFGSLAMFLAERCGLHVTGVTLSSTQLEAARERVRARGLQDWVDLRLQDYREVRETFDGVVSVGMFEHVGRPQYRHYFERIHARLRPGGRALVHSIGRSGPPTTTNPWIRRHIFPGGHIPSASEVLTALEHSGLVLTDLEIWRQHYACTLAQWHQRFDAARPRWNARWGEAFCRTWSFYLRASEAMFRCGDLVVFQLQLARRPVDFPLTRDYLYPQTAPGTLKTDLRPPAPPCR